MQNKVKNREQEREAKIAALTGTDKIFWDKIKKVKNNKDSRRYIMNVSQTLSLVKLYQGDIAAVASSSFFYGFHQGMQYMKNQAKKKSDGGNKA